jgi:peptidoglycan/xylan/chitin deacetylase (PgdA/CDA1 family)
VSMNTQSARTVAITFDDLPGIAHAKGDDLPAIQEINRKLLDTLKKHHVPAIGFVIGSNVLERGDVEKRKAILQDWLSSGMELGNHTYSHLDLNTVSAPQFERDMIRAEGALRPVLERNSRPLRFLRFPYIHTGDTEVKKREVSQFLTQHGYEIATCTVENYDFTFDLVYFDSAKNHDSAGMQRVREAYLQTTDQAFAYYEKLSRELFGHEIPQVMLMHANQLNVDALDDALTLLEKRGYRFVTIGEAQSDPAYKTPDSYIGPEGWMWGYRWADGKGRKPDVAHRPIPPRWVLNEYTRLTR